MKTSTLFLLGALILTACNQDLDKGFISSATLESDLWKISPTQGGTLLEVRFREGDSISQGMLVAAVDSLPWILKQSEIKASMQELGATIRAKEAELQPLRSIHAGLEREVNRFQTLAKEGAAPAQRKDDLETQLQSSEARIKAMQTSIEALRSRYAVFHAQLESLQDQINRCQILAPTSGRITTRYRNAGEASIPGRPILEIGKTDSLWADFFIPQTDLAKYHLGQALWIRIDSAKSAIWQSAQIQWIASEAEFTPKGVQTREARNELMFKARALAPNAKGILKRGMPVEVWEQKPE